MRCRYLLFSILLAVGTARAQAPAKSPTGGAFVDAHGVLRWQHTRREVALFGVNYTTPFASPPGPIYYRVSDPLPQPGLHAGQGT